MKKDCLRFFCSECGTSYLKWNGKCEACGAWNTLVEEIVDKKALKHSIDKEIALFDVNCEELKNLDYKRYDTKIKEFNLVCGSGIVAGSVILLGGDPGIGKSTILMQVCANLSNDIEVLYLSGEESVSQIYLRIKRMNLDAKHLKIANTNNLEEVLQILKQQPNTKLLIVDSIQTISSSQIDAVAGSIGQIRLCSQSLINIAKTLEISVIIVGHVTKDGNLAGPRVLEHMVDTVLYFEGNRNHDFRILRSVKNRFGATNEIGLFAMQEKGLTEVSNPSELFLSQMARGISGNCVFAGIEGSRPILCEIQALVSKSYFGMPKRTAVGYDLARLSMILAVLESRLNYNFSNLDIYLNIVGGFKINEPAGDLAVCAALISALINKPISADCVFFGEIGLSAEIRPVNNCEIRIKEAQKLGFKKVFTALKKTQSHLQNDFEIEIINLKQLNNIKSLNF